MTACVPFYFRAQGDDYRDDISAVVCYLKGPDGTVANEALRQALDAHGPKTLGADLGGKDDESEEDEEKPADGAAAAATTDDTKATRSKQFEQKRLRARRRCRSERRMY